jgi:hypothetical protein
VTDRSNFALGRKPEKESSPRLHLSTFLKATPVSPIVDNPPATKTDWPMDQNDEWGCCVVAGMDHALEAIHASFGLPHTPWDRDTILAYYRTQNPGFDPSDPAHGPGSNDDGGMVVQEFLSYMVKQGVILGFARIDQTDKAEVHAAIYLGLAIVTGEDLDVAQQRQAVWDFVPGSASWGGHCTTWVGYDGSTDTCVTWGELVRMTDAFVQNQVSEAWFVITQAHIDNPSFRAGFDLPKFAEAYTNITGRAFPAPVSPVEPPTPVPPTPPTPEPVPGPVTPPEPSWWPSGDVLTHIEHAAQRAKVSIEAWLDRHFKRYFDL